MPPPSATAPKEPHGSTAIVSVNDKGPPLHPPRRLCGIYLTPHFKGTLLCFVGVLVLTPDSMLIRLVEASDFTLIFYRQVFFSLGVLLLFLLRYRLRCLQVLHGISVRDLLVASLLFGLSGACFALSIVNTEAANTLVIMASSPMFSSLFSWAFLHETPPLRMLLVMVIAIVSIVLVFASSFSSGGILGIVLALVSAVTAGLYFTYLRYAHDRTAVPLPTEPVLMLASFYVIVFAAIMRPNYSEPDARGFLYLFLQGAPCEGLAFVLLSIGPQFMRAAEVSLVMLLETVLGPFWVWLAVGEAPSAYTFAGGALLISTLVVNSALGIRAEHRAQVKRESIWQTESISSLQDDAPANRIFSTV